MKYQKIILIALLVLPILILIAVNWLAEPNYLISSIYKIIFISPVIYRLLFYKSSLKQSITENFSFLLFKKYLKKTILVGIVLSLIYFSAYLIFKNFLDLSIIVENLNKSAKISAGNILLIGFFIVIFNSLLEEFFWRGFMFKELRSNFNSFLSHLLSGIGFSLHHMIFYFSWFSIWLFGIVTIGLIFYAIIMNFIFEKTKDLFSCWLVHAFVDVVQILIALLVFGLI